ncbi:hypothetical protein DFJ77DRAFT_298972 [Powellomyces hirtus]|nr:hypothetical protein DFJ77DRAFT_298972 [Powellomyces hirtus]
MLPCSISEEAVKCLPFPLPSNAVLSCTLWDENVEEALYLPLGTYVHLRNSRIKSGGYNFEAALHGDRQYNGKTHVRALILGDPVDDPVIAEIQTRERILRAKHEAEMAANMPHPANMRHPANMPHQGAPQQTFERETVPANCRSGPHFTPLSSVSSASTQNSLHCRVKVIDHTPCDIRDFCRATCNSCLLRDLPLDPPCVECTKSAKYTYQFSLLIADETGCIPVILSSKTAEDIIGIPPTDMRRSPNALKQLKSKLGALWDVNGAPTDGPLVKRAKQFDCLIRAVPTRRLPCYRFKMLMTS